MKRNLNDDHLAEHAESRGPESEPSLGEMAERMVMILVIGGGLLYFLGHIALYFWRHK